MFMSNQLHESIQGDREFTKLMEVVALTSDICPHASDVTLMLAVAIATPAF